MGDSNSDHDMVDASDTPHSAPAASSPTAPNLDALAAGWLDGTITSADAITNPAHPFYVNSTNAQGFKYKYPEAAPTPDGEDDYVWNKTYTAADSRMYNKNSKDANQSRKFRASKETYHLTLKIHLENKSKHAKKYGGAFLFGASAAPAAKATTKPQTTSATTSHRPAKSSLMDNGEFTGADLTSVSISEKIKSEGRVRKTLSSTDSTVASSSSISTSAIPKPATPAGPRPDKPATKKKGTATMVKKPVQKKSKPVAGASSNVSVGTPLSKPPTASDSESNDGGEYCVCRGPDDHRMMVFCDGGCQDWYHCSCMGADEKDTMELLDRFICPKCTTSTSFTTWKRLCRYNNCDPTHRKAARVNIESKYCSDECGYKFFEYALEQGLRKDNEPSLGGALNLEEAATLFRSNPTYAQFQALGQKPRLPVAENADPDRPIGLDYITVEEQQELDAIAVELKECEAEIEGYDDQLKLLAMVVARANIAYKHANLNAKTHCGYDNRLCMTPHEYSRWMKSEEAKQAFSSGKLGPRTAETMAIGAIVPYPGQAIPPTLVVDDELKNICLKTKCSHAGWHAINLDDYKYMQVQARKRMKELRAKEAEIVEGAETREATKDYYADNITIQLF